MANIGNDQELISELYEDIERYKGNIAQLRAELAAAKKEINILTQERDALTHHNLAIIEDQLRQRKQLKEFGESRDRYKTLYEAAENLIEAIKSDSTYNFANAGHALEHYQLLKAKI